VDRRYLLVGLRHPDLIVLLYAAGVVVYEGAWSVYVAGAILTLAGVGREVKLLADFGLDFEPVEDGLSGEFPSAIHIPDFDGIVP
jgi:hypothetical protein